MVTIYNKRYDDASPDAVYVGRPTLWGNPFTHIKDKATAADFIVDTLAESIESYTQWLRHQFPKLDTKAAQDFFGPLVGKDLICWCAPHDGAEHTTRPLFCHAQILASMAEAHGLMKVKD